jgi:hypothetical protein
MSEFWEVQNARTEGYYIGKASLDMPMSKTKRLKMQARRKGYRQGERSMGTNQQDDGNVQTDSITHKASRAWVKWAIDNNIDPTNTSPETYMLMSDAFVDGYLSGFTKRFTEGE